MPKTLKIKNCKVFMRGHFNILTKQQWLLMFCFLAPTAPVLAANSPSIFVFKKHLPEVLCKKGEFFRECFKVSETTCERSMLKATNRCLNKLGLNEGTQPRHFQKMSQSLGACVGQAGRSEFISLKQPHANCRQLRKWQ